jgi:predicted O-linked N-acetylglucosamine transferase (SPINDLY family)
VALRSSQQAEAAVEQHRRAIELRPNFAAAHFNLGLTLEKLGRMDEAIAGFRAALKIQPTLRNAHSSLLFAIHFQEASDPQAIFEEHRAWNRAFAQPLAKLAQPHANVPDPDRRLRIGYASADFRQHSVSFFIEPLLAAHDPGQFEIFCYADLPKRDATTDRLQKLTPNWREITGRPDREVADIIRRDQIDILVDLAGHTGVNRLSVFATRPAPVAVTYLGYIDTTGMDAIDYRLSDAIADPPGMTEQFHSERLLRLPRTFACYCPPEEAPEVGPPPAISAGYVTFGAFTTLAKISKQAMETWGAILSRVADSRLLILAEGLRYPSVQNSIFASFDAAGIRRERIALLDQVTFEEYLQAHQRIDVMLDTFPVNSHTVTCQALWMGVPIISLAGGAYCQRLGLSVMSNLGLPELVAATPSEYAEIAAKLAADLPRVTELRAGLRQRMAASPLMDAPGFARDFEAACRNVWRSWCASHPK